ncbi:MAG: Scr1 family TA system antitoxin-like transcriptional regulator [Acidimicrobiales bacterium]
MAPTSPTVARWELALRIKARRDELNLSVKTITEHLGFSRNYWSAVENERTVLAEDKFDALMKLMEFDEGTVQQLSELLNEGRRRGWWTKPSLGLDDQTQRFFGFEQGAKRIRTFEPLMVPGLLQTDSYTRAFVESDPMFAKVEVPHIVEGRMRRQERLEAEEPLRLMAVLSEAAVRQCVGNEQIQLNQLRHLFAVADSNTSNIEIRIVPFRQPLGPLGNSPTLFLMDFVSPHLPTVLWQESITPVGPIEDADKVQRATIGFEAALEGSLSPTESLTLIEDAINSFEN